MIATAGSAQKMIRSPVVRFTGTYQLARLIGPPLTAAFIIRLLGRACHTTAPRSARQQNIAGRLSQASGPRFVDMAPSRTASRAGRQRKPPSAAQTRIIEAALREFARNGVGGTSLQMIADDIGVTKAAVYHQYKTKDEIVRAVASANSTA